MSLGLTKPGASVALRHPKTGAVLRPIGYLKSGKAVWPALGASSEDPDDPAFTEEDDTPSRSRHVENDDDDDEDDEDEKPVKKSKSKKTDEDEDDEDDEEPKSRPERQAARYRVRLREAEARERALEERLRKIEDSSKPTDEIVKRDLAEAREKADSLEEVNRVLTSQLAFFKSNPVDWVDPSDAFALAEREGLFDDLVDEDGNVDTRELRRGLKDLAKRKPHLVKKPSSRARGDEEDEEQSSGPSASTMNSRRKGSQTKGADRATLAKRFPVLGSR